MSRATSRDAKTYSKDGDAEPLTAEQIVEEYDEELLDEMEETPVAPLVRAVRRVAQGEFDE